MLTDGCLIDLCGITLMWRSAIGLEQGVSQTILREHRKSLNEKSPQCPVNFLTLHFRSESAMSAVSTSTVSLCVMCACIHVNINTHIRTHIQDLDEAVSIASREPWVYLACGHVYSYHNWKAVPEEDNQQRTCPLCFETGPYVKLDLGLERGFFIDDGPLTHAFVPCGHVTTEKNTQ